MNVIAEPKPICRYCGKTTDMYGTLLTKKLKSDLSSLNADKSGFWRCKFCLTANSREDYVVEKNYIKMTQNTKFPQYSGKSKGNCSYSVNSRKFNSINPSKSQHMTENAAQAKINYLLTHKSSLPNTFVPRSETQFKKFSGSTKNSCNSNKLPPYSTHSQKSSSNYRTPEIVKDHDFLANERKVYSHSKVMDHDHNKYESNSSLGHSLSVSNLGGINIVDSCPNIVTFNNNVNTMELDENDRSSCNNINNKSISGSDSDKNISNENKITLNDHKISDIKLPPKKPKTRLIDQFSFNSMEETKESLKRLLAMTSSDKDKSH